MSVMKRLKMIFSSKANKALDRAEDPRETLDYSYQRQLEMLQKVRRGVADVATSRKRLELQQQQLQQQSDKLEAQTKIGEAFSGISEEMGDVGLAIQRAEDKTQTMQARAGAIDELLASGALDDPTGTAKDDITVELERMSSQTDVEIELARLKGEIGAGKTPDAIEAGPATPADTATLDATAVEPAKTEGERP